MKTGFQGGGMVADQPFLPRRSPLPSPLPRPPVAATPPSNLLDLFKAAQGWQAGTTNLLDLYRQAKAWWEAQQQQPTTQPVQAPYPRRPMPGLPFDPKRYIGAPVGQCSSYQRVLPLSLHGCHWCHQRSLFPISPPIRRWAPLWVWPKVAQRQTR